MNFTAEWPDLVNVSKYIHGLANSGGGVLVMSFNQSEAGDLEATELTKLKALSDFGRYDFVYEAAHQEGVRFFISHKVLVRKQTTLRFVCAAQPGRKMLSVTNWMLVKPICNKLDSKRWAPGAGFTTSGLGNSAKEIALGYS